ncbi:phenylcoumaran benzylic ether reductase Pyrc5-like [Triticum dicoccoides]|uniref:phenylcoumaran benzylic ether reductase Pyrc5-like n=1 Tax=Triticum dicoccoides TaxID=85692 RepID=UPI00188F1318|nr:phenylcoumaran benzylic ether reductase Pyrc5-like [Triticum dicoccoides]
MLHRLIWPRRSSSRASLIPVLLSSRTLNKILYMRPPANIVSHNELIALWEKKAGRTFQIARIPEADLLMLIKEAAYPLNMMLSHSLSVLVRGDQANFDIEPSFGVEAT